MCIEIEMLLHKNMKLKIQSNHLKYNNDQWLKYVILICNNVSIAKRC